MMLNDVCVRDLAYSGLLFLVQCELGLPGRLEVLTETVDLRLVRVKLGQP